MCKGVRDANQEIRGCVVVRRVDDGSFGRRSPSKFPLVSKLLEEKVSEERNEDERLSVEGFDIFKMHKCGGYLDFQI